MNKENWKINDAIKVMKDGYPNTVAFVEENIVKDKRCNRCGSVVLKEVYIEDYPFQCMSCDENMLNIEVHDGEPPSPEEYLELLRDTLTLELD
jgi:hypothetical protein